MYNCLNILVRTGKNAGGKLLWKACGKRFDGRSGRRCTVFDGTGVILGPLIGGWAMERSYRGNVFCGGLLMALFLGAVGMRRNGKITDIGG